MTGLHQRLSSFVSVHGLTSRIASCIGRLVSCMGNALASAVGGTGVTPQGSVVVMTRWGVPREVLRHASDRVPYLTVRWVRDPMTVVKCAKSARTQWLRRRARRHRSDYPQCMVADLLRLIGTRLGLRCRRVRPRRASWVHIEEAVPYPVYQTRGAVSATRTHLIALEADPRLLAEFESAR